MTLRSRFSELFMISLVLSRSPSLSLLILWPKSCSFIVLLRCPLPMMVPHLRPSGRKIGREKKYWEFSKSFRILPVGEEGYPWNFCYSVFPLMPLLLLL